MIRKWLGPPSILTRNKIHYIMSRKCFPPFRMTYEHKLIWPYTGCSLTDLVEDPGAPEEYQSIEVGKVYRNIVIIVFHQSRILSSSWLPIATDTNSSKPYAVIGDRALVPTFILLNELHLRPKCAPKSSIFPRRRYKMANLSELNHALFGKQPLKHIRTVLGCTCSHLKWMLQETQILSNGSYP